MLAARTRLRPILMTSLAFVVGVLPLALATGAGSGAQNAVGTGVVGGMVAATLLAIFFVPVFFVVILRTVQGAADEARGRRPAARRRDRRQERRLDGSLPQQGYPRNSEPVHLTVLTGQLIEVTQPCAVHAANIVRGV